MDNIQIIFEFATKYGTFRDALYLPVDHNLTDEQIEALKQQRLTNWLAIIEAPPAPTEEEASDA
jgi:hypothetical protein